MPCFPMFVDLTDRPCLIVGGGKIAAHKAEKLRPFSPRIQVVAPELGPGFEGCTLIRRPYLSGDEDGMALVIAATDDEALNRRISHSCREKNIPVNVVDNRELCSFLFPSLVIQGELCVGISTGGSSPTAARWLREQIQPVIPPNFETILRWLDGLRPRLSAAIPNQDTRSALYAALLEACISLGRPLTAEELEEFL